MESREFPSKCTSSKCPNRSVQALLTLNHLLSKSLSPVAQRNIFQLVFLPLQGLSEHRMQTALIVGKAGAGKQTLLRSISTCAKTYFDNSTVSLNLWDILADGARSEGCLSTPATLERIFATVLQVHNRTLQALLLQITHLDALSFQNDTHILALDAPLLTHSSNTYNSFREYSSVGPTTAAVEIMFVACELRRQLQRLQKEAQFRVAVLATLETESSGPGFPLHSAVASFFDRRVIHLTELAAAERRGFLSLKHPSWLPAELQQTVAATRGRDIAFLSSLNNPFKVSPSSNDKSMAVASRFRDLVGIQDNLNLLKSTLLIPLAKHCRELFTQHTESPTTLPKGILISGPSGCGKTALISAIANELSLQDTEEFASATIPGVVRAVSSHMGAAVLLVDAHRLIQKEVGASESSVRELFSVARALAPTVILIDDIDAIAVPRDHKGCDGGEAAAAADRLLSTFLMEADGLLTNELMMRDTVMLTTGTCSCFQSTQLIDRSPLPSSSATNTHSPLILVGTTRDLSMLDPAARRPGRFDVHLKLTRITREDASLLIRQSLQALLDALNLSNEEETRLVSKLSDALFVKLKSSIPPVLVKDICRRFVLELMCKQSTEIDKQLNSSKRSLETVVADLTFVDCCDVIQTLMSL